MYLLITVAVVTDDSCHVVSCRDAPVEVAVPVVHVASPAAATCRQPRAPTAQKLPAESTVVVFFLLRQPEMSMYFL